MEYGLDKKHRLKSMTAIQRLIREGDRTRSGCVQLLYTTQEADKASAMAGFSAPKRRLRRAVDRNRIKRILRSFYLEEMHRLGDVLPSTGCHHLFFIYQGRTDTPTADIRHHLSKCLRRWSH